MQLLWTTLSMSADELFHFHSLSMSIESAAHVEQKGKKIRRNFKIRSYRTPLTIDPSVVWYQKGWFSHARSFVRHDIAALSQALYYQETIQ